MSDTNWEQVKTIFFAALDVPRLERAAFLDEACSGDDGLRREIESLLAAHEEPGEFIDRPAIAEAAADFVRQDGLRPGQQVGPYEVARKMGQGGMGVVYLARDKRLDRPVALKLLHADYTQDAARVRRFQQEARAASALNHPNILTIYDAGQISGRDYIVTEFIEGQTLREVINGGPLELREALDVIGQVAHALEAAHRAGIIHRDIKPENLMLRRDGFVKVLDFGLAKLIEPERSTADTKESVGDVNRTNPGTVLGTISYMSPEQSLGQEVDSRSDIFSLGVVLYELLTAQPPFKGDRTAAILDAIIHYEPVPATKICQDLPLPVDSFLARAMEKDRDARYQTAGELRADLKRLQREGSKSHTREVAAARQTTEIPAAARRRPVGPRTKTAGVLWAAIILIAALGFGFWRLAAGRKPSRETHETLLWSNASSSQLTDFSGEELFPNLSSDGKSFLYVRAVNGGWDIFQQRLGGGETLNLTADSAADDYQPAFSPNGEMIAFRSERKGGGIFVTGALGGSARQIADFGFHPAWSPDGKEIVFSTVYVFDPAFRVSEGSLFAVNVADGAKREITTGHDAAQPQWSPSGARIVYWSNDKQGQRDIWTVPARAGSKDGGPVRVTNDADLDWNPVWSSDGRFIYFISKRKGTPSLWRVAVDEKSGQPLGQPESVIGPLAQIWQMGFSRDGRRLIYAERQPSEHLQAIGFDPRRQTTTGSPVPIVDGSKQAIQPDVSPDGQWLVYVLISGAQEDIYVVKTDGTSPTRLTNDAHRKRMPHWSPDGKRITFFSNATGNYEIWTINKDGGDRRQLSFSEKKGVVYPAWSPDGKFISFCYFGEQTYLIEAGKSWSQQAPQPLPLLNENGDWFIGTAWSPDGSRLAGWRANSAGQYPGIYLYSPATRLYEKVSDLGGWPDWFADNRRLIVWHENKLFLVDAQTRRAKEIFSIPDRGISHPVISPDGRYIYYSVHATEADIRLLTIE